MTGKTWIVILALLALTGCGSAYGETISMTGETAEPGLAVKAESAAVRTDLGQETDSENAAAFHKGEKTEEGATGDYVTEGTEQYRDFVVDSVLHSGELGDIHYCSYIPDTYDGSEPYSLYITLPGYQGLYFQGAAMNIRTEEFAFEARKYCQTMIIVAPQLEDWGELSAQKTVALTEYFLDHYNIDRKQVYISGYSGGGETLSLVLDSRPELYTAALMCSSQWDGGYEAVVRARLPVYFVIGESDEYYGSEPFHTAYEEIRSLYENEGLSEAETEKLVVLDVKPASYFTDKNVTNQHAGGGGLFSKDSKIMGWLFEKERL